MRAIIYTRWSPRPSERVKDCDSCEVQAAACIAACEARKWNFEVFSDPNASGASADRPILWAAVAALARGDVLLVARLDRLARDPHLAWVIDGEVAKKGARVLSVAGEGTDTSGPEGRLIQDVLAAINSWQRKVTAARTKAAMIYKQDGRHLRMSYRLPYGWRGDPVEPAKIVRDEDEQLVLAKIVSYRAAGHTLRAICDGLAAEGLTCRGHPWHHEVVRRILARSARQGSG